MQKQKSKKSFFLKSIPLISVVFVGIMAFAVLMIANKIASSANIALNSPTSKPMATDTAIYCPKLPSCVGVKCPGNKKCRVNPEKCNTSCISIDSTTPTPTVPIDSPVTRKVLVIDFNPILENRGGKRLREYIGWNDPIPLEKQYINDIKTVSHDYFNYKIVRRIANIDAYPEKSNGYTFTDESYLAAMSNPDDNANALINYEKLLIDYNVCSMVNAGDVNEVWLWGAPWFGYYESIMAGDGAYYTNAPPLTNTACISKLHIMGFSYERGISEMLEDFGHRTEGTMVNAFGGWFSGGNTDWDKYTKSMAFHPNEGSFTYGCGSVHEPFNAESGYDWSNKRMASTTCSNWSSYPPAPTKTQNLSCTAWGCDGYGYLKMWLTNLPNNPGLTSGKWNNWWKYLADILPLRQ